jgi:diadenosine tetraphosphatase ApaH/serine/threonine PP2A family protein phosphatase
MGDLSLDGIIETIREGNSLPEQDLVELFLKVMEELYTESNILELQSPITVCGDIHGQLYDLFELFDVACQGADIGNQKFLFMGDYVDRGRYSIETLAYLCALKLRFPGQFYLLRGNHECRAVNQMYGFYAESIHYYGHAGIWTLCNDLFDLLPMAALIDNEIFSVHGGLSPGITLIEKISLIHRQCELPDKGELCDLCWSDPEDVPKWRVNQRGAGYLFGADQVAKFLNYNKLRFVTRSHQLAMNGFEWFFDKTLVTVWSAPNYMYRSGNKASVMKIGTGEEGHEMVVFEARPDDQRKKPDDPVPQGYFL